jgi:colanic acid/amylovoran biosynthesis glycosyltransferase
VARHEEAAVIGYLVNHYPAPSHTFIRREIHALEKLGTPVARFSVRPHAALADPADVAESEKTRVLLDAGAFALVGAVLRSILASPARFWRALTGVRALARREGSFRVAHVAWLAEACLLKEWLETAGCAHLHVHFATNPASVGYLCRMLGGPPWSFTVHGSDELPHLRELSVDRKLASASFAVAVSEYGRARILDALRTDGAHPVELVRCGLDRAQLARAVAPFPAQPRLVCVARLSPEKAHHVLLRAAALLRDRDVAFSLDLLGDGPCSEEISRDIDALELRDRVFLRGWVPSHEIRGQLDRARVSVLASHMEGLPVSIMESLAAGRPAVATAVGGVPELVRPGESGWLVPPGDPEALAGALAESLALPLPALREMGERGRAIVSALHDVETEASKLAALFASSRAAAPRAN